MIGVTHHRSNRRGSVYLAVLGAALVASMLAFSAVVLQRIQNRQLSLQADIRQAQLNAEAAIELGLLIIDENDDWRETYADANAWFTRSTGSGMASLTVSDPVDGDLSDDDEEPYVLVGIGTCDNAEQRAELYVDPRSQPADSVIAAANAGGSVSGQSDVDWEAVIETYQDVGTEINVNSLPTTSPNLGRNTGIETGTTAYWFGTATGIPFSDLNPTTTYKYSGTYSLAVDDRSAFYSGAMQSVDHLVEAGDSLYVEAWIYHRYVLPVSFIVTLYTKGTNNGTASNSAGSAVAVNPFTWTLVSATVPAQSWSGQLEYAFVKFGGVNGQLGNTTDFWLDDLAIREPTSGRYIYHQVLGPGVNPFGAANANGIYWIDCGGNRVIIERSRILGSLVLLNPGSGSRISNGPVFISPATVGYPSLIVDGDFSIRATYRALNEAEVSTNLNPSGVPYDFNNPLCLSTDNAPSGINDVYPSEIQGLIAVSGNLTYENQPRIRGEVIVGGTITGTPDFEHQADSYYSPPPGFTASPDYVRRPSSISKVVLP
jgi:hypothetical protein